MKRWKWLGLVLFALVLAGCGGKRTNLGLEVDLYLHPEAGSSDDLILQTAIRKRLRENKVTQQSLIHVRVMDGTVFLNGTVRSEDIKKEAATLAKETRVNLNDRLIASKEEIKNRIEVQP